MGAGAKLQSSNGAWIPVISDRRARTPEVAVVAFLRHLFMSSVENKRHINLITWIHMITRFVSMFFPSIRRILVAVRLVFVLAVGTVERAAAASVVFLLNFVYVSWSSTDAAACSVVGYGMRRYRISKQDVSILNYNASWRILEV